MSIGCATYESTNVGHTYPLGIVMKITFQLLQGTEGYCNRTFIFPRQLRHIIRLDLRR